VKYINLDSFPTNVYGSSTGFIPMKVKSKNDKINMSVLIFPLGENLTLLILGFFSLRLKSSKIEETIAAIPPNLDGIERKIA
jgi:hypothetical protein